MRICHDCLTVNHSYRSYCQKCSGKLTNRPTPYMSVKISKKRPRRVPAFVLSLLGVDHAG